MSIPFQYNQISTEFIGVLNEKVLEGESIVLLGPRYGGKRHVMFRIRDHLSNAQVSSIVRVKFLKDPPVSTEEHAQKLIQQASAGAEPGFIVIERGEDLLDAIDQLHGYTEGRVVLLAANVDGMAHHLARRFLDGVRRRVEEKWLVVVLSGEDDFKDLVYGPNSEFTCANQYVLQGFAEDEFNRYIDRYLPYLHKRLHLSHEMRRELWVNTGGNAYFMRMILWYLIEAGVRSVERPEASLTDWIIPSSVKTTGIPGAFGAELFLHATDLISRDPQCWEDLERLIKGTTVRLELEDNPPGRLELAGVAIREGNRLKFASKLMESFIKRHYDDRRFGDLYASSGLWEKAFGRYAFLTLEETMRPSGINDKSPVETTINALCASLHPKAAEGVESVQRLFVRGLRSLLGFRDVTFWRGNSEWEPLPLKDFTPKKEILEHMASFLPRERPLRPGLFRLGSPLDKCSIAAVVPSLAKDEWVAVVIGDFEKRTVISRERERLARKVFEHFIAAYSHAVSVGKIEQRLQLRDKHVHIITSIFDALGSKVISAHQVITMAAKELRRLGYSRVLFCLVDPEQTKILGELDDSDNKSVNLAEMTEYLLDDPTKDLQPYVIFKKEPKIIPDATREPLANPLAIEKANLKSFAIVPILAPEEEAIGTIHIERIDGAVPGQYEVDDLLLFGRQLAVAIEQSERVNMLQSALDKIPEPVLILDSLERARYANKVAKNLLGVPVGWQSRSQAQHLSGPGTGQILDYLHKTLEDNHRRVRHLKGIGNDPNYRGAVLFDRIHKTDDWRGQTVGALLHIEDLNYFYRIFEACRFIADANDTMAAMQSMLQSMEKIGHEWGRLYVIDPENPDRLRSMLCFGPMVPEDREDFNRGVVLLQPRGESKQMDWNCIVERKPLVFCWDENEPNESSILTEHGLRVVNANPPVAPIQTRKKPGDFWIDLPLFAEERELGKMTLQCGADFRPEDFEMLKVFFDGLLDAFLRREREFDRQKRLLQQTADNTVGLTAHNINSDIVTISSLLSDYREKEASVKQLKELNDRFEAKTTRISTAVKRMTERLGPLSPKPERLDLVELIEETLSNSLPKGTWEFSPGQSWTVFWDRYLIENSLIELIHNSKAFVPTDLRVCVHLQPEGSGHADQIKVIYADNGPGVPPELKDRIFEQFFSNRPNQSRSTGIGLRFVRRVVEAHGGRVDERGQFGQGAKFEMRIPREITQI